MGTAVPAVPAPRFLLPRHSARFPRGGESQARKSGCSVVGMTRWRGPRDKDANRAKWVLGRREARQEPGLMLGEAANLRAHSSCQNQPDHPLVCQPRPERVAKGGGAIVLDEKVGKPCEGIGHDERCQYKPGPAAHHRQREQRPAKKRACAMERASSGMAVGEHIVRPEISEAARPGLHGGVDSTRIRRPGRRRSKNPQTGRTHAWQATRPRQRFPRSAHRSSLGKGP